jgi:MFS family permease
MSAAIVLALGALDLGLVQSIILPALSSLAAHDGASIFAVAWLATGFLLAAAVAGPLFGRLGDLVGKKRMILVSLAAFVLGSLVCALSSSIGLAIAGERSRASGRRSPRSPSASRATPWRRRTCRAWSAS